MYMCNMHRGTCIHLVVNRYVHISLGYAYLPTSCGRCVFILPHWLAVLDLGSVRQIHYRATVTGVDDAVQYNSLGKRVHQPVVQVIINDLSSLQASHTADNVNWGRWFTSHLFRSLSMIRPVCKQPHSLQATTQLTIKSGCTTESCLP